MQAEWKLHFSDTVPRIAIWVSRQDHCLFDLIWQQRAKEFTDEIPLIISNHHDLQGVAEQFGSTIITFQLIRKIACVEPSVNLWK